MGGRWLVLCSVAWFSCIGEPVPPAPQSGTLALQAPSSSVKLMAGETLLVQLLVVGDAAGQAEVTATALPAFAAIDGTIVRLAPSRAVAPGVYHAAFSASAGGQVATAEFDIEVTRFNTNPEMSFQWWSDGAADKYTCRIHTPLFGDGLYTAADCRFDNPPVARFDFKDLDHDPVELEFELSATGTFTGTATHRVTLTSPSSSEYVSGTITLAGLQNGTTYRIAMRACDVAGGCWQIPRPERAPLGNGWLDVGELKQGCEAGATCGLPTGGGCSAPSDCASRQCDFTGSTCCTVFRVGACL